MTRTVHPDHGEELGRIGVRAHGKTHYNRTVAWSWKCYCGEWWDGYRTRAEARREYQVHRHHCEWARRREAQIA